MKVKSRIELIEIKQERNSKNELKIRGRIELNKFRTLKYFKGAKSNVKKFLITK